EAVIDARDVLVLIDRRGGARAAEVDGRLVGVRGGDESQKLCRVTLDAALRNDIVRGRLAGQRIEDLDGGAGKIAGAIRRRRHKRRPTERTRDLTARLPVEKEEGALLAMVDLRDSDRTTDVGAELIAIEPGRLGVGRVRLKGRERSEGVVAVELPQPATELVGPTLGHDVDLAAGSATDIG